MISSSSLFLFLSLSLSLPLSLLIISFKRGEIASWTFSEKKNFREYCWTLLPIASFDLWELVVVFGKWSRYTWPDRFKARRDGPSRGSDERRIVGWCVTCCEETFKQARPDSSLDARTRPTASMTGTRMLRSIINRRRGDSRGESRGSSRLEGSESSPEPGSQAERRLNSTLYTFYIAFDYARSRWLRAARESAQFAADRRVAVLKSDFSLSLSLSLSLSRMREPRTFTGCP